MNNKKTGTQNDTARRRAWSLGIEPKTGRSKAKAFAVLALTLMLAAPFASATDPDGSEPTPATTSLVLNAATPSNPIVSYTEGTEPVAEVRILNTAPMAGGFTITDPTGADRFTNQFSNEAGVVVFFEVYWGTPRGDWIVTHKPGLPAMSPEPKPGEAEDPAFDPDNFASEVLLTFNIDPLRTPHKVAYETGEGAKSVVDPLLEPWRDESVGSILSTAGETVKQEVQQLQDKYPIAVDPVGPAEPVWETVNDAIGGKYSGAGGGTGGCADGCTDGGNHGGTSHYGPPGYSFCAYEDTYCSFSGSGYYDVAYGNQGYYRYAYSIQGGIYCTTDNFGDPVPGVNKACYIRPSGGTTYMGPGGYDWCNYEHLRCEFSGTYDVAFGNHGYYYYRYSVSGGLSCTSDEFAGDPFYGTQKACWITPSDGGGGSGGTTYIGPDGYDFCAYENQYCSFIGTRDVAFGNHGYYYYAYGVTGGIDCTNDRFGDPYYGVGKACYIREPPVVPGPGCMNWQRQETHWKWVNHVLTHAPFEGTAIAGVGSATATDVYVFFGGGETQTFVGATLETTDGKTVGLYTLMTATYYTCSGNGNQKVVLKEIDDFPDVKTADLWGASQFTDQDDLTDTWMYSAIVSQDVKTLTLDHQFKERDSGIETQSAGRVCVYSYNESGDIYGLDISVSFGQGVSIGGTLKYLATETDEMSYQYCFGNNHSYDWDNLGGGTADSKLAKAFRTNW